MRTSHATKPIWSRCRLAAAFVLAAAALAGPLSVPAFADGPDAYRFEGQGRWQERGRANEHWRYENRYNGYYSAPPIIYTPPGYYQQPGASLNFNFPLFR